MMTLTEAALSFNKTVFTDVNGLNPFSAQVLPFNDTLRSSTASRRRILETDPAILVPEIVIEQLTGEYFLTSLPSTDHYRGKLIRSKRVLVPASSVYSVNSALGILTSVAPTVIRGSDNYLRKVVYEDTSIQGSEFSIILPSSSAVAVDDFLYVGADYMKVVTPTYIDETGFRDVVCVVLQDAVQTLPVVLKGVYDPVTETYTGITPVDYLCIVEDREKSFVDSREDALKILPGDVTITTVAVCAIGDSVGDYKVLHSYIKNSTYVLHCRRA